MGQTTAKIYQLKPKASNNLSVSNRAIQEWYDLYEDKETIPAIFIRALCQVVHAINNADPRNLEFKINEILQQVIEIEDVLKLSPFNDPSLVKLKQLAATFNEALQSEDRLIEMQNLLKLRETGWEQERELLYQSVEAEHKKFQESENARMGEISRTANTAEKILLELTNDESAIHRTVKSASENISQIEQQIASLQACKVQFENDLTNVKRVLGNTKNPELPDQYSTAQLRKTVQDQLEKRVNYSTQLSEMLDVLESDRADINYDIEHVRLQGDIGDRTAKNQQAEFEQELKVCTEKINSLVKVYEPIKQEREKLRSFLFQLDLIENTNWDGREYPDLTSMLEGNIEIEHDNIESNEVLPKCNLFVVGDNLRKIIAKTHLSEINIILITLYEIMAMHPNYSGKTKNIRTLLYTATDAGLLNLTPGEVNKYYGYWWCKNKSEFEKKAPQVLEWIMFSQFMVHGPLFRRTKDPLPWDINDILSKEQIEAFQLHLIARDRLFAEKHQKKQR